jgi:spermidine/putrescine transport system ATP-binding protein
MRQIDVELRSVTKRFGDFVAVRDIDLAIERGKFVTLLGPSGCGKTTTLRMIGGFEAADAGEILIDGKPLQADLGAGRPTRMVFQSYALFPHMTVTQNIAFGLRMMKLGAAEIARRVDHIIPLLGLGDHATKFPRQLSGGQQQRVALARALVTRPRVLLLDEPLGALDLKMRKHMQGELKKLQREVGITFIYVTHDQEEAMNLSDTIVVMDTGRIVQVGTPQEIYNRPSTAYVADFIGETNLVAGTVRLLNGISASIVTGLGPLSVPREQAGALKEGDRVFLTIRPEHVRLEQDAVGGRALAGRITDVAYLGSATRVTVAVGDFTVRADVPGVLTATTGAPVRIGWQPDQARLLPYDERFAVPAPAREAARPS